MRKSFKSPKMLGLCAQRSEKVKLESRDSRKIGKLIFFKKIFKVLKGSRNLK